MFLFGLQGLSGLWGMEFRDFEVPGRAFRVQGFGFVGLNRGVFMGVRA